MSIFKGNAYNVVGTDMGRLLGDKAERATKGRWGMSITPGPWRVVGGGRKILIFGEEQTHAIALVYPEGGKKRYEANARAITEVPEMVAYLRKHRGDPEAYALLRRIEGEKGR